MERKANTIITKMIVAVFYDTTLNCQVITCTSSLQVYWYNLNVQYKHGKCKFTFKYFIVSTFMTWSVTVLCKITFTEKTVLNIAFMLK